MSQLLNYCISSVSLGVKLNDYNNIDIHIHQINKIFTDENIKKIFLFKIIQELEKKFPSLIFNVNIEYISENIMSEFVNFEWNYRQIQS